MNKPPTATSRCIARSAMLSTVAVFAIALPACGGSSDDDAATSTTVESTTTSDAPESEDTPDGDADRSSAVLEKAIADGAQFDANDGPERSALPELGDAVRVGDEIWFSGDEDGEAVVAVVDPETFDVETIEVGSFERRAVERLSVGSDTVWAQIADRYQIVEIDIDSRDVTVHALPPEIEAVAEEARDVAVNDSPEGLFVVDDEPWFAAGSSLFALDPSDPATITDTIDLSTISEIDPSSDISIASGDNRFFLSTRLDDAQGPGPTFMLDPDTAEVEEVDGVTLASQREIRSLPVTDAGVLGIGDDSDLAAIDLDSNEADLIPIGFTGAVLGLDAVGNVAAIVNPSDTIEAFNVSTGESTQVTLGDNLDGNRVLVVGDSLWTWTSGRVVITILTPES